MHRSDNGTSMLTVWIVWHTYLQKGAVIPFLAWGQTQTVDSDDVTKCAETLQKYVDVRKQHSGPLEVWVEKLGKHPYLILSLLQVVTALALYLPTSDLYPVLSSLPPPDATNPDATTTFTAQSAIQDSLPILQEIIQILEKYEDTTFAQEVDQRRKRLGAPPPDVIRREVGYEVLSASRVGLSLVCLDFLMTSRW